MKHDRYFKFLVAIIIFGLFAALNQASPGAPHDRIPAAGQAARSGS